MIKNYLYIVLAFIMLYSCTEEKVFMDDNVYEKKDNKYIYNFHETLPQELIKKEVDKVLALDLSPGFHWLNVNLDSQFFAKEIDTERIFVYYMPENLKDNFDVVLDLHGNFNYDESICAVDFLDNNEFYLNNFYSSKNTIFIKPLGSIVSNPSSEDVYGWYIDNGDINYIDFLIECFKTKIKDTKKLNLNPSGIFCSGHSSGAIFSWYLTYYRSEIFSAVVPRFGMVKKKMEMAFDPEKSKVPMRIILGEWDTNVDHDAAMTNAESWANTIYGIEKSPKKSMTKYCRKYSANPKKRKYDKVYISTWQNEKAIVETYTLHQCFHGYSGIIVDYEEFVYNFFIENRKNK